MSTILTSTCFPCCWNYNVLVPGNYSPCTGKLKIYYTSYTPGFYQSLAVKFNGGSLVGSLCSNTDPYVTIIDNGEVNVDVATALSNGVWTSSVTIDVYSQEIFNIIQTKEIGVLVGNCTSYTKTFLDPYGGGVCAGYGLVATVTVNANGTYSIA